MDFRTRQAKIPIPRHRFWWWQTDPSVVDSCYCKAYVTTQDKSCKPDWYAALYGERDNGDGHQSFVGHGVNDCADDGGAAEAASNPAVDQIGDAGIKEEGEGVGGLRCEDEVTDGGGREKAGEGKDVGKGVNVLVRYEGR